MTTLPTAPAACSRRSFLSWGLKASALGAGALALEGCTQAAWAQGLGGVPGRGWAAAGAGRGGRVVVVGAGLAGLVCADALERAGHQVEVYEASERVGGRVRTATHALGQGRHVEVGAEFFDQSNTVCLGLLKRFGLALLDMEAPSEAKLDGFVLHFEGRRRGWEELVASLKAPLARWRADAKRLPDHIGPSSNAAAKAIDQTNMRRYLDDTGAQGWGRRYLEGLMTTEYGLDPEALSAAEFLRYVFSALGLDEGPGAGSDEGAERFKVVHGNEALPHALAASLKGGVKLRHALVGIAQGPGGYRLSFECQGSSVQVEADQVVLALPMTLLRQLRLELPVPALQREAWAQSSYGTNAKLVLATQGRPWRSQGEAGGFATDGQVAMIGWDPTRARPEGSGAITCYLGGRLGATAKDRWAELSAQAQAEVASVFPGFAQAQPRFLQGICWAAEPWARGSYASWGPGEASRFGAIAGASVGGVHFAGEHLGGAFRGHMEGAARSGLAAAEAVKQGLKAARA